MKVLAVHNYYRTFGGEDSVFTQDVSLLRAGGVDVVEYARRSAELENDRLPWRKLARGASVLYSNRTVRDVRALLREHRPDVALVQNVFPMISPSVYYMLDAAKVPIVQLIYNYRWICPNASLYTHGRICEACVHGTFFNAIRNRCCSSFFQTVLYALSISVHRRWGRVLDRIDAYVTPDEFLKGKLVEAGVAPGKIHSLHNPFDAAAIAPTWQHGGYILFVGRIERHKGIFTLLKAMESLPHVELRVVGTGNEEDAVRKRAAAMPAGNVKCLGYLIGEPTLEQIRGAAAVVLPTEWFDNSPLIVDQAFACGKPVIASRIDGIPEVVEHGRDGLLFSPGDVGALTDCIRALLSDEPERLRLAHNARMKAERCFTTARRLEGLQRIFQSAVAGRRKG